jgi:hypothetical protein
MDTVTVVVMVTHKTIKHTHRVIRTATKAVLVAATGILMDHHNPDMALIFSRGLAPIPLHLGVVVVTHIAVVSITMPSTRHRHRIC